MAGFAVANPQPADLGAGLSGAADNLVRTAAILEQRRRREEDMRTTAILGASQSDIGIFAPEKLEELQAAKTSEERNRILVDAGQLTVVRKQQHADLIQQARAIQDTIAQGGDPSSLVAQHQGQLTQSGLPGNLIASQQSNLGTEAATGQARRGQVTEQRDYASGVRKQARTERKSDQAGTEAREEARWQSRYGEAAQDKAAERAAKADLDQVYTRLRVSLGLPDGTPRDVIDSANAASTLRKTALTPQQVSANTSMSTWLDKVRNSKKAKGGTGGMDDIIQTAVDGVTRAGSTNSTFIPVPIETSSGLFGSTYTIENKDAAHAQFYLAKMDEKAFEIDKATGKHVAGPDGQPIVKDEDAARFMRAYGEAASTGKNQWLTEAMSPGTKSQEQIDAERKDAGLAEAPTDADLGGPKITRPAPRGSASPTITEAVSPTVLQQQLAPTRPRRQTGSVRGQPQRGR